jgi:hypothetical protein
MPTIDLTDSKHAALTAAIRRWINEDPFPRAPRLDPLRSALKLDQAAPRPPPAAKSDTRPQAEQPTTSKKPPRSS